MIISFLICLCLFFYPQIHAETSSSLGKMENAWTEIGENNRLFVRAIFSNTIKCPEIKFEMSKESLTKNMKKRVNHNEKNFPVLVCEANVPKATTSIILEGEHLPVLQNSPKKIVLIGDTGCRIKGKMVQDCFDKEKWPFQKIAEEASKVKPDVILHLGDYHYRETACPANHPGCIGAVYGDNWQSWKQDFFSPAHDLLLKSPVVFVRGDHESCGRAGIGWFYFLEPRENPSTCQKYSEPYAIQLGNKTLLNFDSSQVLDDKVDIKNVQEYSKEMSQLNKIKSLSRNIFVTHKPVWGIGVPRKKNLKEYSNKFKTKELQVVMNSNPFDSSFDLLLSGHVHLFQFISLGAKYPPQLISGESGTLIEYYEPKFVENMKIDDKKIEFIKTIREFGFSTLEFTGNEKMKTTIYDLQGTIISTCEIFNRKILCDK